MQQKTAEHTYIHWVINWNSPKTEERNGLNSPAMRQRREEGSVLGHPSPQGMAATEGSILVAFRTLQTGRGEGRRGGRGMETCTFPGLLAKQSPSLA